LVKCFQRHLRVRRALQSTKTTYRTVTSSIDRKVIVGAEASQTHEATRHTFRHVKNANVRCFNLSFVHHSVHQKETYTSVKCESERAPMSP
jgi:hypothetical protein